VVDAALLPPSLQDARGLTFLQLCGSASQIDLAQSWITWIDQAPAAALPALASQAGLMTDPGWLLATTEDERRALLKEALALAKARGTPWSIKRALALSGWPGMAFEEGLPPHTFALCTAEGIELVRVTRAPITKTSGLVLECTWTLDTKGRPA